MEERFWNKVEKTAECWNWLAAKDQNGYGRFGQKRAHQVAYILKHGKIPDGKELNHVCQNRRCVRWSHLEALTHLEHLRKTPGTFGRRWAQVTHCVHGHLLAGSNLLPSGLKAGRRRCRACRNKTARERKIQHPY